MVRPCANRRLIHGLAALALTFVGSSCSRSLSPADMQMAKLREEVARVSGERDKMEQRMTQLELERAARAEVPKKQDAPQAYGPVETPKQLPVIKLVPKGMEEQPDEELPEPSGRRPKLTLSGSSRGAKARGEGRAETEAAPKQGRAAADPSARRAFETAMRHMFAREYDRALDAFAGLLVRYPNHPRADMALYQRGEAFLAKGDAAKASEQYEGMLLRFASSSQVPYALLRGGIAYQKLGDGAKAKAMFDRLLRDYPRSPAAQKVPREDSR